MGDRFIKYIGEKYLLFIVNKIGPTVYLLKITNDDKTLYKIGYTSVSIPKRIKELQTGCPYEIKLVDSYRSDYGRKIEKTLHNLYSHKHTWGEWFELDSCDEFDFRHLCNKYENIQESITKNNI